MTSKKRKLGLIDSTNRIGDKSFSTKRMSISKCRGESPVGAAGLANLSISDCQCPICFEVFVEPVTTPCSHEICISCLQLLIKKPEFLCPLCRKDLRPWVDRSPSLSSLINRERWELIRNQFPDEIRTRLENKTALLLAESIAKFNKYGIKDQNYKSIVSESQSQRVNSSENNSVQQEFLEMMRAEEEERRTRQIEEERLTMEYIESLMQEEARQLLQPVRPFQPQLNPRPQDPQLFVPVRIPPAQIQRPVQQPPVQIPLRRQPSIRAIDPDLVPPHVPANPVQIRQPPIRAIDPDLVPPHVPANPVQIRQPPIRAIDPDLVPPANPVQIPLRRQPSIRAIDPDLVPPHVRVMNQIPIQPERVIQEEAVVASNEARLQIYVENMYAGTRLSDLRAYFSAYGEVTSVVMKEKNLMMYAFVTFGDIETVDSVMINRPHYFELSTLELRRVENVKTIPSPATKTNAVNFDITQRGRGDPYAKINEFFRNKGHVKSIEKETPTRYAIEFDDYDPVDRMMIFQEEISLGTLDRRFVGRVSRRRANEDQAVQVVKLARSNTRSTRRN